MWSADAEFIRERIRRFVVEAPSELQWQAPYVEEHDALPLYLGWTETLAIRPDGTLVCWSTEGEWSGAREVDDPILVNLALVEGAAHYPRLRPLIPTKPASATTCDSCQGRGTLALGAELSNVICKCGGTGWLPAAPR
jgi:hypothetical protein